MRQSVSERRLIDFSTITTRPCQIVSVDFGQAENFIVHCKRIIRRSVKTQRLLKRILISVRWNTSFSPFHHQTLRITRSIDRWRRFRPSIEWNKQSRKSHSLDWYSAPSHPTNYHRAMQFTPSFFLSWIVCLSLICSSTEFYSQEKIMHRTELCKQSEMKCPRYHILPYRFLVCLSIMFLFKGESRCLTPCFYLTRTCLASTHHSRIRTIGWSFFDFPLPWSTDVTVIAQKSLVNQ